MPDVVTDRASLSRRLEILDGARQGPPSAGESSAVAECAFRIAVDPATEHAAAFDLLQRCVRLDRSNPKFHYHLARLCFRRGELDSAGYWLEKARCLCPTSHRIWTHIGLLQREISERYKEDAQCVPGLHLKRWKGIAEAVMSGKDIIDPALADLKAIRIAGEKKPSPDDDQPVAAVAAPASDRSEAEAPARRFTSAGVCRWTAINDLVADDLLETDPGEKRRDALRQPLGEAAANAARPGGHAAFAILASEWLLRGYPAAFIHRIRPADMPPGSPASMMLDTILELLALDRAAVPRKLADALAQNRIPPLVAAVIHRLHVLGKPPSIDKLIADLRAARAWLERSKKSPDEHDDETAMELMRALEQDAKSLEPRPRVEIADFPPDETETPETPEQRIAAWRDETTKLGEELVASRARLTECMASAGSDLAGEANRTRELLANVEKRTREILEKTQQFRDSGQLETSIALVVGEAEQAVRNLQPLLGPIRSKLSKIPTASVEVPDAGPPRTVHEQLAAIVADLESRVRGTYDRARDTFDVYSAAQRRSPYLQAVRMSIGGRKAETLYRLGHRAEGRRAWGALLGEDYLDVDVLRNIAVCDSRADDVQRCLDSWRAYAAVLYFYDVCSANPAKHAAQREEFHRHFGNAYAPRAFHEQTKGNKQPDFDRDEIAAFFLSTPRVRLHIRHQLMVLLNRRLQLRTPPFILGVTRAAKPEERDAARQRMETWVARLCGYLPSRVGRPFAAVVSHRLAEAAERMKSAKEMRDLATTIRYKEDERLFLAWISDVVQWKLRLHFLAQELPHPSTRPEILDVLVELCAVDEVPIDTSAELFLPVAGKLADDPDVLRSLLSMTTTMPLLHFVFPDYGRDDPATAPARASLYRRLTEELTDSSIVSDFVRRIIDYPAGVKGFNLYPGSVERVFKEKHAKPTAEDVDYLRDLHERCPVSSGIARDYAMLLALSGEPAQARTVLTKAVQHAFHPSGREACEQLLKQLSGQA